MCGKEKTKWIDLSPGIALAAVVAAVIFLYPLAIASRIPLLDPDEGLHASIAQEMVERGDWIVPRLFGQVFLDKPILYFWCEALSLRLFGMSEAAVRLPGLLLGLAGAVATGLLGRRMFDRRAGLAAGVCYATMILPAALAQAPAHDVALVPWVVLSLLLFWEADRAAVERVRCQLSVVSRQSSVVSCQSSATNCNGPRTTDHGRQIANPWALAVANGLVLALAILTKGLAGVALVGIAYGGYLLATRRLRLAHCLRGAVALVIAAVLAANWYLAVESRSPGFLYYYFVERHLLGFATGTQQHGHAHWWYYLPVLLGGGLPWIAYVPVTLGDAWQKWHAATPGDCPDFRGEASENGIVPLGPSTGGRPLVFLGSWLIGGTVFLSLGHSKMVTYIWPVFPAVALLASVAWSRLLDGSLSESARRWMGATLCGSCLLGPIMLPAAMLVVQRALKIQFSGWAWAVLIAAGLTALIPWRYWAGGRPRAAFASAVLAMTTQFAAVVTVILPAVAEGQSARELARHFDRLPGRLFVVEERIGSLVFYLPQDLRAGLREGQIVRLPLEAGAPLPVFAPDDLLAVPDRALAEALPRLGLSATPYERAGHYRIYRANDCTRAKKGIGNGSRELSSSAAGGVLGRFALRGAFRGASHRTSISHDGASCLSRCNPSALTRVPRMSRSRSPVNPTRQSSDASVISVSRRLSSRSRASP
ncbi:MAG: glycosyltransferase family 39 protein [Thermoguttaceae bacterium]|jgi:4-amino-4-deoxy-L-arabinose transferase-like glycosyltransferase